MTGPAGPCLAQSEAFCDATRKIIDLGNFEEVPPEVDTMVEEAPDDITGD